MFVRGFLGFSTLIVDDKSLSIAMKRMTDYPTYGLDRQVILYPFHVEIFKKIGNRKEKLDSSVSVNINHKTSFTENPINNVYLSKVSIAGKTN